MIRQLLFCQCVVDYDIMDADSAQATDVFPQHTLRNPLEMWYRVTLRPYTLDAYV